MKGEDAGLFRTSLMGGDKLKLLKTLLDKLDICHPVDMVLDIKTLWKVPTAYIALLPAIINI